MKKKTIGSISAGICSMLLLLSPAYAQNRPPYTTTMKAAADCNGKIEIIYDLIDPDDNRIKVNVQLISEDGAHFALDASQAQGDIGYPVATGKRKKIICLWPLDHREHKNWTVKITADDLYKIDVTHLVNQVDTARLLNNLKSLVGTRSQKSDSGKRHVEKVRKIISRQFTSCGLQVRTQDTVYKAMRGQNIIGKKRGQGQEEKLLVLCAHYDTVEKSPGADDNGSGVAGMLEAMRILSPYNFARSIVYLACDLEEEGHIGSQAYVSNTGGIDPGEYVEGCINFDMIGFYSTRPNSQLLPNGFDILFPEAYRMATRDSLKGNFALNISNSASGILAGTFNSSAGKYVPQLKLIPLQVPGNGEAVSDLRRSDHASFWDKGYPAIYIGDGANTRNFNYHSPKDTLETVNLTLVANVVKTTVACMAEMAQLQHSTSASCRLQTIHCVE